MDQNDEFLVWIANTVHGMTGIWPQKISESQRQCSLTYSPTRMVDCQEVSSAVFEAQSQAFMRVGRLVVTDLQLLH